MRCLPLSKPLIFILEPEPSKSIIWIYAYEPE